MTPIPFNMFGWTTPFGSFSPWVLGPLWLRVKTDLKSAFRLIPIHPNDWHLLGIYWKAQYFVDLYLFFGFRSAPFLFNQLSDALEWIVRHNYNLKNVLHILDFFNPLKFPLRMLNFHA